MQSGEMITVTCDRCGKVFRVRATMLTDVCPKCGSVCIINDIRGEIQTDLER